MEGRKLNNMVQKFVAQNKNACAFTSLGELSYLSCVALVDGVVGNSSSGLLEVPTFMKGTVNIGDRQRGRLQASSVINCDPDHASIGEAIKQLFDRLAYTCMIRIAINNTRCLQTPPLTVPYIDSSFHKSRHLQ